MATTNALFHYEFTCPQNDTIPTHKEVINGLQGWVKKFIFQLEEGDSGYRHFQGKISLIKKRRLQEIREPLQERLPGLSLRPTVKENVGVNFYVIKSDTHLDGPWSDEDQVLQEPTRDLKETVCKGLLPFQQSLLELSQQWDMRTIHIIFDEGGNKGKSLFIKWMGMTGRGKQIPFVNDYKDIMRMVMDMPTQKSYFIDLPKAINKEKLFQMYAGIETIKGGYAYDDRYSFKDKYFDCPQIFVFTNSMPDFDLLSRDRWKVWTIKDSHLVALRCNTLQDD